MSSNETEKTTENPTEDIIKRNVSEVLAENLLLRKSLTDLKVTVDELKGRLSDAEALLSEQAKAPKIARIKEVSELNENELAEMSLADLEKIEKLYDFIKVPTFQSSADLGGNIDPYHKLHNMYKFDKKV